MSSLIVLLPAPGTSTAELAYAVSPDGRSVQAHGTAAAALLPMPRGAGAETVAVVPVCCLSWHRVELPRGVTSGSPRLRSVLEGLLEEHLLDEPEALHFAMAPGARAGEPAWVATCDRAWLRAALLSLEQAGRPATRVAPEFAPQGEGLHAIGESDNGWWVATSADGVLTLPLAAASVPLLPPLGEDALAVAEPAVTGLAEQLLGRKLEVLQPFERWVRAAQGGWDLAQFEFASSGHARTLKKLSTGWAELLRAPQWRPVRWAALALAAINLVGLNAYAWKERSALQAKRDALRTTLTTTFPQVKVVVDPRVQMEREVAALRMATGAPSGRDLESLLAALAAAMPAGRTPTGIEYNGTELRARGLALTAQELPAVAGALKGRGYAGTLQGEVLVVALEDVR